jgi:MFS family permease
MFRGLPRTVIALGLVSLCMDTSSELIHSLLPLYLVAGLGASASLLGLVEGIAEATASLMRVFAGVLSDRAGQRKPLILAGYGLAALSKPLFPLASGVGTVLLARVADRIGKGIRGAPRDALLADVTPEALRGAAFGLRQSLDTVGAVIGPLAAGVLMGALEGDIRAVLWAGVLPAVMAVLLIVFLVQEPEHTRPAPRPAAVLHRHEIAALPPAFWRVAWLGALLSLARFSEAFLLLRASDMGLPAAQVPLVLVALNVAYALSAWPLGHVSDRLGRGRLLVMGLAVLVLADVLLALDAGGWAFGAGIVLWGLHMGATQGVIAALVADVAPAPLRGTAFGVLHCSSAVALLLASVIAGGLWSALGAPATFIAGAVFALMACVAATRRA